MSSLLHHSRHCKPVPIPGRLTNAVKMSSHKAVSLSTTNHSSYMDDDESNSQAGLTGSHLPTNELTIWERKNRVAKSTLRVSATTISYFFGAYHVRRPVFFLRCLFGTSCDAPTHASSELDLFSSTSWPFGVCRAFFEAWGGCE
jgi:hypothetical protein